MVSEEIQFQVTGITISKDQIKEAKPLSEKEGVKNKTIFKFEDFTDTNLEDGEFDVVWAIESVCHAEQKIDFLREAKRLLKEKGRIIIVDGFLLRSPHSQEEEKIIEDFCDGLSVPTLEYYDDFKELLSKRDFKT